MIPIENRPQRPFFFLKGLLLIRVMSNLEYKTTDGNLRFKSRFVLYLVQQKTIDSENFN